MRTVFIQTNKKQLFGAKLAQFCILRNLQSPRSIQVELLNVDELPLFQKFLGTPYRRGGTLISNNPNDLQSFTLSRFLPPEHMNWRGRAVVIDPDIFTLIDIEELFSLPMGNNAILACRKKTGWDTSVMVLDCSRLTHWNVSQILNDLASQKRDYNDIMTLRDEQYVGELSRDYNDLDHLTPTTKLLHTTNRLTQPWKTGLPIDFTRSRDNETYLGIIPKPWILTLLGRWPRHYQQHPDSRIEQFFFDLVRDALQYGALTREDVEQEMRLGHIRNDLLTRIAQ